MIRQAVIASNSLSIAQQANLQMLKKIFDESTENSVQKKIQHIQRTQ